MKNMLEITLHPKLYFTKDEHFFNENILLDKIPQTMEIPDLININNINLVFYFIAETENTFKQTKYIIIKIDISCDYINQLGFREFYKDNDYYYYVNINKTNAFII